MVNDENMAVLVLAAGQSARMGKVKQLLPWKDTTLLGNAIQNAQTISKDVVVVLGAFASEIKNEFNSNEALFIENKGWKNGLGSSLAFGVNYILESQKKYEAILVTLGDQPLIDTIYLKLMVTSHNHTKKGIIATAYGHRAGVPALFNSTYFGKLIELHSDNGAKTVIDANKNDILILSPNGKAIDVDTVEDYKKILNS